MSSGVFDAVIVQLPGEMGHRWEFERHDDDDTVVIRACNFQGAVIERIVLQRGLWSRIVRSMAHRRSGEKGDGEG